MAEEERFIITSTFTENYWYIWDSLGCLKTDCSHESTNISLTVYHSILEETEVNKSRLKSVSRTYAQPL